MSFADRLASLAQRAPSLIEHLATEEATKNALVMPFIAALGYDVFNPQEVVPELTADVGVKKGEKVDYAIKQDGRVMTLLDAKYRDLWERPLPRDMLYQLVVYAISQPTNPVASILYPTATWSSPRKVDSESMVGSGGFVSACVSQVQAAVDA